MGLKPVTTTDAETATIALNIDGETVTANEGVSLYDVISGMGKIVPAMCYHYTFDPFGSCGMCLVMQEGKKSPVRACTAKAAEGMVVRTEGDDLFAARKKAVEKHLSVHPLDCPVCDADGHCELQDMAFEHEVTNLTNAKQKNIPEDTRSLVLDFNMNRCIACGECVNICKDVLRIDALQFMKKGGFTQVVAKGDQPLDCEFCGDCLAVCPVGAITNKFSKYVYKPWQLRKTTTTCNYCGDGCQLYVETKDTEVVRVTSPLSWKNKWGDRIDTINGHGGICVRGRFGFQFINSQDRLKTPLMRQDGRLSPVSWIEALETVAERLAHIKGAYGADAVAGLITARCTNEELYVFQKFMRTVIGTNNVDSSARYGHMNFVRATHHALGIHRMMNTSADLTKAQAILVVGANMTETNPVASVRVKAAIGTYHASVIVVDAMYTNLAKLASHPTMVAPGTEGALVRGMIASVLAQDLVDPDVASRMPEALQALKDAATSVSLDAVATETGVSVAAIHDIAKVFAEASRSVIVCGEGIVRQKGGYDNVLSLIDLAWVTGALTQPGCGINTFVEEGNEQGAVDMGAMPEFLPGPVDYDAPACQKFSEAWGVSLPNAQPGRSLMEILEACRTGHIKALYVVGENPLATLPKSFGVEEALNRLDLLVCQDPFLTETAHHAHVVFPACTFAEKDGTVTNQEGKVQFVRPALDPLGESALDWHVMVGIADGMGHVLPYETTQDIQAEIRKLLPGYYNLGQPRPVMADPTAYLRNGYRESVGARYAANVHGAASGRPYAMKLIQLIYHSGKLSTKASGLMDIAPNTRALRLAMEDCRQLGVEDDGGRVRVTSDQGSLELAVQADIGVLPGTCAFPEHFNDPPVKDLSRVDLDPVTRVPYFKVTHVTIEKI